VEYMSDTTAEPTAVEETITTTYAGHLEMKVGKGGWKVGYAVLIGGSLYFYKNMGEPAKGHVDLKGLTVVGEAKASDKKKFAFQLDQEGAKSEWAGQTKTKEDRDIWVNHLNAAVKLEPCEEPSKEGIAKRKKQTLGVAMKKKALSGAADSSVGKAIMKKIVNEETTTLINALKALVSVESGTEKKAIEMEKNIIKIAVKAYILVDNKDIKGEQFLVADKPLRDAFNLLVKVFNGRQRAKKEKVIEALQRVEADLKKAEKVITELLAPHLSGKNMMRLASIFSTVANVKFLETVFYNESVEDELEKLIDAMDYYTQFHYT